MPDTLPESHYRKLERIYAAAPINEYFRPQLHITHEAAEIVIPVREAFLHAGRAVHGSVMFKALDDSAFFAAQSVVDEVFVLTVSFTIYYVRPVTAGTLTAKGRLVHRSRRLLVAESSVVDSDGREIARGSGTFMPSSIRLEGLPGS